MPWQAQTLALSAGALAAGLALTWGEYRGPRALVYAAKPLATLLILALATLAPPGADPWVARWIVARADLLARRRRAADAALGPLRRRARELPGRPPLLHRGLHARRPAFQLAPLLLAPLIVAVWLVYRRLAPGLGSLRIPVIVYIGVIVVMAWQALARCAVVPGAGPPLAAAGALLFATSDSALALARFQGPFRAHKPWCMPATSPRSG